MALYEQEREKERGTNVERSVSVPADAFVDGEETKVEAVIVASVEERHDVSKYCRVCARGRAKVQRKGKWRGKMTGVNDDILSSPLQTAQGETRRTLSSTRPNSDPLPPPEQMLPPLPLLLLSLLPLALLRSPHLRLSEPHDRMVYFCLEDLEEALFADWLEGFGTAEDGATRGKGWRGGAQGAGCHYWKV